MGSVVIFRLCVYASANRRIFLASGVGAWADDCASTRALESVVGSWVGEHLADSVVWCSHFPECVGSWADDCASTRALKSVVGRAPQGLWACGPSNPL